QVSFVDVPGHERFVKNMLAGVHGIDAVALIVAADEGVMPQTREHFDICRLLGVKHGLVVLTKTDLVEEELLTLVRGEVEELTSGSFLESAPVVSVSAKNRAGLDALRATLRELANEIAPRSKDFVMRLPIDRAFSMKGFGAVVTGTLVSGSISEGDELELLPTAVKVRARGVQVHGATVQAAHAGQRTAVNLAGIELNDVERGMVLAEAGALRPSQVLDVQLKVLKSAPRSIRSRARLRVHLGSAEVLGRISVLNKAANISAGESGFAQLRLETAVVAVQGEHFIIRSYSPSVTIGGGVVLDPFALRHRRRNLAKIEAHLNQLVHADRSKTLVAFVVAAGERGLTVKDLVARTGLKQSVVLAALDKAIKSGGVIDMGDSFIAATHFEGLSKSVLDQVRQHHQTDPLSRGLPRELLRERIFSHVAPEVFRAVMHQLETANAITVEKELVRAFDHAVDLSPEDSALRDQISGAYESAAFEPPALASAFERARVTPSQQTQARKLLQMLVDDGTLVRIQPDLFLHQIAANRLRELVINYASEHEPDRSIDVPTFKELTNVSRKYAIPLLEYLDRISITRRAGDKRVILKSR
ncbi:MAG TPA: selenocysteine-specific translation elongation factor, partial [Pyrinomonadaceae bacterium]|nr:selenocysteine-specific translation elongation factor [Pyrinomonadaceae bacterium]